MGCFNDHTLKDLYQKTFKDPYNFFSFPFVLLTNHNVPNTMRRFFLLALTGLMIVGLHACTEDEFIEPATINLEIKMTNADNPFGQGRGGPPFEDELEFSQGRLLISSIEIDGKRADNDDYYFSRDFETPLTANLTEGTLSQPVSFDIPQGSYEYIRITLNTTSTDTCCGLVFRGLWEKDDDDDDDNDDDKANNAKKTSLQKRFSGIGNDEEVPLEISLFETSEPLKQTIQTEEEQRRVVLKRDNWETIEITLDMSVIFRYMNPGRLRQAEVQGAGNNQKIIISRESNRNLHDSFADRVEKSMKAVIK